MRDVAGMGEAEAGTYMMYAFTGAAGYFLNGILADLFKREDSFHGKECISIQELSVSSQ